MNRSNSADPMSGNVPNSFNSNPSQAGGSYGNGYSNNSSNYSSNSSNTSNTAGLPQDDGANYGNGSGGKYFTGDVVPVSGILEVLPDYGVLRQDEPAETNLPKDVYISQSQIKRFALRMGDLVTGYARPPKEGERYLSMLKVEQVDGMSPEEARKRPLFSRLTPIFPYEWMKLETTQEVLSTRIIDILAPIGKGQRAMIVAPPKAGKTWLLQDIATGIANNHPEVRLMVALIGERPEEVTDMKRKVKGEVYASNFDEPPENQTRTAEITLERAKRLAEKGQDVVILMDSLTRLARAYNMVVTPSGRTLTGGFDPSALFPAKHFFGAARKLEEGGSLTIIATALVDTGSRMDDVIFEEFKGTGNMELRLDRTLAERRIYPSIDIKQSSTRHEEHLYDKKTMDAVIKIRRMIDIRDDRDVNSDFIGTLKKSKTNIEFIKGLNGDSDAKAAK